MVVVRSPGPDAAAAFRLGMLAAAAVGLSALAALYWLGTIGPFVAGYVLLFLFPVYMLVAAAVFSVWLGYDKDTTALRPVTRDGDAE